MFAIGLTVFLVISRRGFIGLWAWNLANLAIMVFFLVALAQPLLPVPLFVVLHNGLGLLGLVSFAATTTFLLSGTPTLKTLLLCVIGVEALLLALTFLFDARWPRALLVSSVSAVLCGQQSLAIARLARKERMKIGAEGIALIFGVGAMFFTVRSAITVVSASGKALGIDAFEPVSILVTIILFLCFDFALLLVLMTRLERSITAKVFEMGESRNDLQILYDASTETAGSVDLDELIPRILDLLHNRLKVDFAAFYLREPGGDRLTLVGQRGLDTAAITALMGPQQVTSTAWQAYEQGHASARKIEDYPDGPIKDALSNLGLSVIGAFPLAARGESLGSLTIGYRNAADLDDMKMALLETMTLQLGSVVRAAGLHDELNRANARLDVLASTDALTGLANRRTALRVLEREADRARRGSGRIAVIMCDIDHFKRFNDENGHDCGDFVLANTATTINRCVRTTDLASRWGGEEFLVILGESEPSGIVALAERIRARVEAAVWEYSGKRLSVTLTLGVAICTADTDGAVAVSMADAALYEGKMGGRNRVSIHASADIPSASLALAPHGPEGDQVAEDPDIVELHPLDD
jgi:diguanylate cyclase (GGDEF)-like protein